MKLKSIFIFGLLITFFACSNESVDNPEEVTETDDSTLLKKIIFNKDTDDEYTETFNYDGNKLTSIDHGDGWKNVYTYENNKIVREDQFYEYELAAYITLEYDSSENLTSYTEFWLEPSGIEGRVYKHTLTYNNDNSFTNEVNISDSNSQAVSTYIETYTLEGKNITKIEEGAYTLSFSYDDKNGIYKNVHAIEVLNLLGLTEFGSYIYGNTNNVTSFIEDDSNISDNYIDTYEYTYNENNYPKTCIYTSKYGNSYEDVETIEYFYE